jgi:hypothetical protein
MPGQLYLVFDIETVPLICLGLQLMESASEGEWTLRRRGAYLVDPSCGEGELLPDELSTAIRCSAARNALCWSSSGSCWRSTQECTWSASTGATSMPPSSCCARRSTASAPHGNLMEGTRYRYGGHTDLLDELCFYNPQPVGATKRYNFDFYARAFGIDSPKAHGVDGTQVAELYHSGRYHEIAEYCLRDVAATWELFTLWYRYLRFE